METVGDIETNTLTRHVMIEKGSKNNKLFIYTLSNSDTKNPLKGAMRQVNEGRVAALKIGLEPIEYSECIYRSNKNKTGRVLLNLLKLVLTGKAKNMYVQNINFIIGKNKVLQKYIMQILVLNGVKLITKNGVHSFNYVDCMNQDEQEGFYYFVEVIRSSIKEPLTCAKLISENE